MEKFKGSWENQGQNRKINDRVGNKGQDLKINDRLEKKDMI